MAALDEVASIPTIHAQNFLKARVCRILRSD